MAAVQTFNSIADLNTFLGTIAIPVGRWSVETKEGKFTFWSENNTVPGASGLTAEIFFDESKVDKFLQSITTETIYVYSNYMAQYFFVYG